MKVWTVPADTFVCLFDIEGKERFGTVVSNHPTFLRFRPYGETEVTMIMHDVFTDVSKAGIEKRA